jgi:ubiquinone/menaquinone biosynthesis C-methylase UbiE
MAHELMNILVNHIHDRELRRCASLYLKERLIDIGCGEKPYCEMFRPFITEHIGVDHLDTLHDKSSVDLFGTAYSIPVEDGSFDCAVCTAVLEHLEEPEQALRECHRVLRVGGFAVYSVPFIWHLHEEPRDFYRFSKYGLQHLFQKCGFSIIELKALSGFWVTFGQLLVYNLYRLNRGPLRWFRIVDGLGLLLQGLAYALEQLDRSEQWTWMYLVVARKNA